ncbi:hypothetical protein [Actinomadura sp. B10D3]|uniref:hypothetical protein n=1 Tax=Actinomadura sp. B10D3 TaxID=3153557 RepID=UPI00325ED71C
MEIEEIDDMWRVAVADRDLAAFEKLLRHSAASEAAEPRGLLLLGGDGDVPFAVDTPWGVSTGCEPNGDPPKRTSRFLSELHVSVNALGTRRSVAALDAVNRRRAQSQGASGSRSRCLGRSAATDPSLSLPPQSPAPLPADAGSRVGRAGR